MARYSVRGFAKKEDVSHPYIFQEVAKGNLVRDSEGMIDTLAKKNAEWIRNRSLKNPGLDPYRHEDNTAIPQVVTPELNLEKIVNEALQDFEPTDPPIDAPKEYSNANPDECRIFFCYESVDDDCIHKSWNTFKSILIKQNPYDIPFYEACEEIDYPQAEPMKIYRLGAHQDFTRWIIKHGKGVETLCFFFTGHLDLLKRDIGAHIPDLAPGCLYWVDFPTSTNEKFLQSGETIGQVDLNALDLECDVKYKSINF